MKSKKTILITIAIIIILGISVYSFYFKTEEPNFDLEKVEIGTVIKEVSETGTIRISEERNLSFKNSGRIEKINVKVGDIVNTGQQLARLDSSQLYIQLKETNANLGIANAKKIDAQVSLKKANQDLQGIQDRAEQDLVNAYEDATTYLNSSYLKIYDTLNVVKSIQRTYFNSNNQEGISVKENVNSIESGLTQAQAYIKEIEEDAGYEKIEIALAGNEIILMNTTNFLEEIRDIIEKPMYRDTVSSTDKTSLDTQRSYIISVYTNIVDAQQRISTTKITNRINTNTAKANIFALETKLQENGLYQAQIDQAQARVSLLKDQIQDSFLRSPSKGQIIKTEKEEGETVSTTESVVSFLPDKPLQVKVDIYEEDIVYVSVDDSVNIILAAFPDQDFEGIVVSIKPSEKLIGGVVYYEVIIDFVNTIEQMKPGMTADVIIRTDIKENVLTISKDVLIKDNGNVTVRIFNGESVEERQIEIGLEGDSLVEIILGLEQGDEVIID
ncbi:MAG: efflux RND transporter periplasmic adaptor subunit [Patescibacteria group bacterium]|nr:efflux RND transporter periplasmic adaptor subunit [Patescibacteria group bacterium]